MSWSWLNQPVLWDFYVMLLLVASLWMMTDDRYRFLFKAWRDRRCLPLHHLDLSYGLCEKSPRVSCMGRLLLELKYTSTLSCRQFCESYREYRTAGQLVFWKPWPPVELKKVFSVTKHGFVLWAQSKPNTRLVLSSEPSVNQTLEIYKAFQDRLTFLNRHMID